MTVKIFSGISEAAKALKDPQRATPADVVEGVGSRDAASKGLFSRINDIFHIDPSRIVENVNHLTHEGGIDATIYPTYGYPENGKWTIPLRGRVHQKRQLPDHVIAGVVARRIDCTNPDLSNLVARSRDFTDDSRSGQTVSIQFDSDPKSERHGFPASDFNGLIESRIELSDERARELLEAQGDTGWLAFTVVSDGHTGRGRVRLIEPEGLSVVTDIDDTIKVTLVPGDKDQVLRNTLCEDFRAADGMADKYRSEWADATFHYVSGGPWQLYRALQEFLIDGAGGFPQGSFHMTYHPKNFLSEDTREILIESIVGSLGNTFNHKVNEISRLMERFPGRRFVLVGDSGEVDPEVYRHITEKFPGRVEAVWIRDVLNDREVNPYRLEGMNVIKVDPPVCATIHHYQKLSTRFQEVYNRPYARNTSAPCG